MKTLVMKSFLLIPILCLVACEKKREDSNNILLPLELAAWQMTVDRADADKSNASPADGVDYQESKREFEALEAAAKVAGIDDSECEIAVQRGKKRAAEFIAPFATGSGALIREQLEKENREAIKRMDAMDRQYSKDLSDIEIKRADGYPESWFPPPQAKPSSDPSLPAGLERTGKRDVEPIELTE